MWVTQKRLARDVARWREAGWVTAPGETEILKELAKGSGPGLAGALAVLAAVLLGFAVMSFVAANWQDMPRTLRLGILFGGLWAAYGTAGVLFQRGLDLFGHAAVLAGVAIFGASIMLIAQMFHIDGNPPDAVLMWALGALLAGTALRSNPALAFAMVLMVVWYWMESAAREAVYWPFLFGWAAVAAAFTWQRWLPGLHIAALALSIFTVFIGYLVNRGHAHELVVAAGLAAAAASFAGARIEPRFEALWSAGLTYGAGTAFAGLYAMQFLENILLYDGVQDAPRLIVTAMLSLALALGAIAWGFRSGNRALLWSGYIGFSLEILSLYFKTVGSLIGTSLFFLIAALIVAALAALAWRLHARETSEVTS